MKNYIFASDFIDFSQMKTMFELSSFISTSNSEEIQADITAFEKMYRRKVGSPNSCHFSGHGSNDLKRWKNLIR